MYNKPIIVFEGIDCSGKSVHTKNVVKFLQKKKLSFISIREPGGNKNSEKIRKLILNKNINFDKSTDLFLYFASRNENINKVIKKNFKKKIIIIDRFVDSTMAYQHYGMKINKLLIRKINNYLLKDIKISFTFLNVVNEKNLKKRLALRKKLNRYDKFNINFYKKVQKGFLKISKNNKKYLIIDSNKDVNDNKNLIINKLKTIIAKK
mgnify:CR=1 FL=1